MARCLIGSLLLAACGPQLGEEMAEGGSGGKAEDAEPPMWRACDEARAALPSIAAPADEPIGHVEAGQRLPVYRISAPEETAESLANRALAIACVMTGE